MGTDDYAGLPLQFYARMSAWYQAGSALGNLGALSVLLTGLLFWKQMVRNKIYMKLIMSMSLCDFLGSVVGVYGFHDISYDACTAQAVCWYVFLRAAWMYTAWMAFTLFTHVTFGKVYLTFPAITVITVVINTVLFVLPLMFSPFTYGGNSCGGNPGGLYVPSEKLINHMLVVYDNWMNAVYFMPLVTSACVPLVLVAYTRICVYPKIKLRNNAIAVRVMRCIQNVQYYPMIMALFWLPNYIVVLIQNHLSPSSVAIWALRTLLLSTLYPLAVAVNFFYRSSEARMRWKMLLGMQSVADNAVHSNDEYDNEFDVDADAGIISSAGAVEASGGEIRVDTFNPTLAAGGELTAHIRDKPAKKQTRRPRGAYEIDFDDDAEVERLSEDIVQCRKSGVGRDSRLPEIPQAGATKIELPDRRSSV